jgi:2-methylcitrate dehydratase PrpD
MFAQRIQPNDLRIARHCLIDAVAAGFTAIGEPSIEMLWASLAGDAAAAGQAGAGRTNVLGRRALLRADDAALLNGTMVSLQLFDDNCEFMRGHPSAPLWPAVLAVAEANDQSLRDALAAFVVGFEVECRLGMTLNPSQYETGWHATATQGIMAAAVASLLLMDLPDPQAAHALGIAASMAGGLRRNFGSMTMSLHAGLAAGNGLRAATLASRGFTADPDIFGGMNGYGDVFSREWPAEEFAASLPQWGSPALIGLDGGPIFKMFPCGRPALFGLQSAMELQHQHRLDVKRIRQIRCAFSYMFPRTLIHPFPSNGLQGKTSFQYCVAAGLLDENPDLDTFTDAAVQRAAIVELIRKIEVRVPPELQEHLPEVRKAPFEQPVTLEVELDDGRVYSQTVRHLKGTPQNPLRQEDLRYKFEICTERALGGAAASRAVLDYLHDDAATVRGLLGRLSA